MLQLSRMDWEQIHVDYFDGETRSEEYRGKVNEMAEAPVLLHGPVRTLAIRRDPRLPCRKGRQIRAEKRG